MEAISANSDSMTMGVFDDNPVAAKCVSLLLGYLTSAFIIVSTPKSGTRSFVRYLWLGGIVVDGNQLLQEISSAGTSLVINVIIIGVVALVLLQYCNFLVITRLDADDLIKGGVFGVFDGVFYKTFRTIWLIFNLRGIGTSWQIQRLNRFPRFYNRHSNKGKPSCGWYIVRQLLIIAWQYIFLDVIFLSSVNTTPEDTDNLFGHGKEFKYLDATGEQ